MPSKRFAIRTVRHGSVKIGGKVYRPSEHHRAYDGRFDGLRFAFGLYPDSPTAGISLWGTEEEYRCQDESKFKELHDKSPIWVDGRLVWDFWKAAE